MKRKIPFTTMVTSYAATPLRSVPYSEVTVASYELAGGG